METVLIVDDDPAVREVFLAFLERGGFSPLAVSGGAECLELLRTRIPDLVILDMMMEPMDGWDTLLAIQKSPKTANVPVVVVTGKHPTHTDITRYGGLIEDFIMKPVNFSILAGSIRRAIGHSRDLLAEAGKRQAEGCDPALIANYIQLNRKVRIARTLVFRFRSMQWVDQPLLERQEEELLHLHAILGFPDRLLTRDAVIP